jgi:hypothetical protein
MVLTVFSFGFGPGFRAPGRFFEPFGRPREYFGASVDSPLLLFRSELDDSMFFLRELPCDEDNGI